MTTSGLFGGSLTAWCRVSHDEPLMVEIDDEYFVLMDGAYPAKALDSRQDAFVDIVDSISRGIDEALHK